MKSVEDIIIDAVDNRFKVLANKLQFDKTYYGKVVSITDRYATVNINGVEYKAQIKDGILIANEDIAVLKAPNGNFSFLYIDGKLGETAKGDIADLSNQIEALQYVELTSAVDLNTLTEVGRKYKTRSNAVAGSCLNSPTSASFSLEVIPTTVSGGYLSHLVIDYKGNIFIRGLDNNVWGEWKQLSTTDRDTLGYSDARSLGVITPQWYVTNLKNGLCLQLLNGTQLGSELPVGLYHVITTCPWHDVTGGIRQIATKEDKMYIRYGDGANAWNTWVQVATTSKTDILPYLKNQWVVSGSGWEIPSIERLGSKVFLSGFIKNGTTTANTIIMTLPAGFRPTGTTIIYCRDVFSPYSTYKLEVYTSGDVALKDVSSSNINLNGCYFSI